jgi:hypothetical protein
MAERTRDCTLPQRVHRRASSAHEARILRRVRRLFDLQPTALETELHRLSTVIEAIGPAPAETIPG